MGADYVLKKLSDVSGSDLVEAERYRFLELRVEKRIFVKAARGKVDFFPFPRSTQVTGMKGVYISNRCFYLFQVIYR